MGGGKSGGGGTTYVQPNYAVPDMSGMYSTALSSFQNNMSMALQQTQQSMQDQIADLSRSGSDYESTLPKVIGGQAAEVDWETKNAEIKNKMRADYEIDKDKKIGRLSTVLTSPILDSSTPVTTGSLLTGG